MSQMTQKTPSGPANVLPFAAMLGASVMPMVASAPVIVLAFWVTRQAQGGFASLLGVMTAVTFFASGIFVVSRLTKANPVSVMALAVSVYLGQVIFLGVVILSLSRISWLDGSAFAVSVLVVALVWQLALVRAFVRMRKPVYDWPPTTSPDEPAESPDPKQTW